MAGSDVTGTGTPSSSTHTLTLALELPSGDITSVNSAHSPVNRISRSAGLDVLNVTLNRVTGWGCVLSMTSMVEADTWILSAGVGGGFCAQADGRSPASGDSASIAVNAATNPTRCILVHRMALNSPFLVLAGRPSGAVIP